MYDGIILIDKPKNYTSRDVVNIVSKKLNTKKVGHTGTLDPIATGVLVICVGSSTKLVEYLTSTYKEYIATFILGISTDTLDITGNILKEEKVHKSKEEILEVLNKMVGTYMQEVPIYSAVKVNGKKLYEYARSGKSIELPKREVDIKKLELISINDNKITIKTTVSKGTYIRSLINDIASNLNTIGTMCDLKRTKQGIFNIDDCYTLEDIKNNNFKIITKEEVLKDIYSIDLDDNMYKKVSNGVILKDNYNKNLIAFKKDDKIIAIYKKEENNIKPYKMFL